MKKIIVPDANVFIKLLYPESEHKEAKDFFKYCNQNRVDLFAPDLFRYEVLRVVHRYKDSIDNMLKLLDTYEHYGMNIVTPSKKVWLKSQKLASSGHPKSGFPSMYDSIYHALAIENDGIFITADRRHYEKSKPFGHIAMLSDWQIAIEKILHSNKNSLD